MRVNTIEELERASQAYPLLVDLKPEFLMKLFEIAEERSFETNEIIFGEGAQSKFLFLIATGQIALEISSAGKNIVVQTLGAGDAMGWSAITELAKTHFQARALNPVRAIAFDGARLVIAFEYDHDLGYEMMKRLLKLLTGRLDSTRMQLIDMYGDRKAGR